MTDHPSSKDLVSRLRAVSRSASKWAIVSEKIEDLEYKRIYGLFTKMAEESADEIYRLQRREYVMAQHEETGRYWSGPREEIPARYSEVPDRAEGGPLRTAHEPGVQTYADTKGTYAEAAPAPPLGEWIQEVRQSCLHGGDQHCPYFKPGHDCCDCGASAQPPVGVG